MVIQRLLYTKHASSIFCSNYRLSFYCVSFRKHKRSYQQKKVFPTLKELFISVTMKHIYMTHILSNKCTQQNIQSISKQNLDLGFPSIHTRTLMYLTYRVLANVINEEKEILNRGLIPFGFIIIIVRENGNETIVQNNISEKIEDQ